MTVAKEIIKTHKDGENMKQVWWLPQIYWELSLKDSPLGSQGIIDEINSIFKDYSLFILLDIDISAFSGMKKNEISNLEMEVNGKTFKPLKSYSDDIKGMIDVLKPMYSKMLGQMGENIEFYIFDNTGKNAISPEKESIFNISFNDFSFEYNLPLSSLVNEKSCPVDNKKYNGGWKYCPYHGAELVQDN